VAVLIDPPAGKLKQLIVSTLLAVTVVGIPTLMLLSLLEHRRKELKRVVQVVIGALLVVLVAVAAYLVAVAADRSTTSYPYHVYGTCAAGACGLNERKEPSAKAEPLGQLRDGDRVQITCQANGERVRAPNGLESKIWDRLENGAYVSDIAVDTPPVGSEIPACEQPTPIGGELTRGAGP
jgi:hypothetical protein